MKVTIHTDGACIRNPGPGGWAAILKSGRHERLVWGNCPDTTNNRMELTAAIKGLEALTRSCSVQLHSDSQYLVRGMTEWLPNWQRNGRWQRHQIKNRDLWQQLLDAAEGHDIEWIWVRGHAGNPMNERVDRLATAAAAHSERRLHSRGETSENHQQE